MKTAARILFSLFLLTVFNNSAIFAQKIDFKADLEASAKTWQTDYNNQDADAIAKHYTEDAQVTRPDGSVLTGPGEIKAFYAETFASLDPKASITVKEVVPLSEDMVQVNGAYHVDAVVTDSGQKISASGNYTNLSRKVDGQWKIFRSMISEISAATPSKNR